LRTLRLKALDCEFTFGLDMVIDEPFDFIFQEDHVPIWEGQKLLTAKVAKNCREDREEFSLRLP